MPEQAIDVNAIIGTYGLAVALVVIGALFGIFKVWPFVVKRAEVGDEEKRKRHEEYIGAVNRSNEVMGKAVEILADLKARDDTRGDKTDNNHNEVVGILRNEVITRLDRIDRNTGSGGIMGGKR